MEAITKKFLQYIRVFKSLRPKIFTNKGMREPRLIDKPPGSNILVLAPHPDDEVIGCGGTLYKHHLANDMITSVYLTDGRKGDPTFSSEDALVKERKKEAKKSAEILGINNLIHLGHRDRKLVSSDETVLEMSNLFKEINPDVVYVPFFLDNHPDHIATNEIFITACKQLECKFKCCTYEVWTPLIPNRLVDISDQMEKKIAALNQHKTQLKHFNYIDSIRGLNTYRSITAPTVKHYAEAFFYCEPKTYITLFEEIRVKDGL